MLEILPVALASVVAGSRCAWGIEWLLERGGLTRRELVSARAEIRRRSLHFIGTALASDAFSMVREGQRDISREKGSETIELVEERLVIEKAERPRERAVVRIVPVEREERVDVMLDEESVEIERVEVNRRVDAAPSVREERGVMIIPVVEEVLVVEKHLILREEIRIHRRHEQRREQQVVTLRSEEAHVEHEELSGSLHQQTVSEGEKKK